ncbi:MAG: ABC transporter substrate-binding protein [Desulfofustis sp. PB-SRB1]|jgi:branched-chain amino acid transport system substrate-binding protein|nr:ABC transporter substrate-binding protein [Desulfofustis sp. PB-SRB1]MBM1002580.1 ABC transporter substrate-binding protein [Desulfofustis sp. PB-SRB1]HBH27922.1 branched-chain amino acid ABC transporter substrate-binding protein [Desulfofustis sp.]HBH32188.1 branched-chain amino acid ABC transporter substrate-binding protein [Desulfofustis sp.]
MNIRTLVVSLAALCISASPVMAADTIKIGAILAVTGPASFLGGPEARTLEMLVAETNAAGGIDSKQVELIIKDSGANPEKAISFAKQLIEEERVVAVIGPSTSGETMKVKKIFEQAGTPLISCAAAEVIVNPVARYVFKTPQNDSFAVRKIYQTMQDMGIAKIAVLAGNTGFGKAGKEQLTAIAPEMGIEIVEAEVYDKDANDLSAVVAKIKANPDVQAVVNWSIVPAQAIVAKNIRQAGWDVPLFQSHGFGNIKYVETAGAAAEGIIFPAGRLLIADQLADDHPQKAVLTSYITEYEKNFDEQASTFGGHAYDAYIVLKAAIEEAGTDRAALRDAIEGISGLAGTGGVFTFSADDHNGLDIDSFEMITVKAGKFVPLAQ